MKLFALTLAAGILTLPVLAIPAQAAPAASCSPSPQDTKRFATAVTVFVKNTLPVFVTMRGRMLDALTADHRAAVATLMGNLIVAPNPDFKAAAASIDAMLTPAEAQGVRDAFASFGSQALSFFQQVVAQYRGVTPPPSHPADVAAVLASQVGAGMILVHLLGPAATITSIQMSGMAPSQQTSPAAPSAQPQPSTSPRP